MSEKIVKEKFDEMTELTDEINQNHLAYYFKGNTFRKDLIVTILVQIFFKKEMKLEEVRKYSKINLNQI